MANSNRDINVTDNVKLTRNAKEGVWYLNRYNSHYDRTDSIRFTSEEMKALKASLTETVIRVRN